MEGSANDEVANYLRALLMLQLHPSTAEGSPKPEILLAKAGLSHTVIAELLMKNPAAVAKSISRAKKS
jgi:hypothetical protein